MTEEVLYSGPLNHCVVLRGAVRVLTVTGGVLIRGQLPPLPTVHPISQNCEIASYDNLQPSILCPFPKNISKIFLLLVLSWILNHFISAIVHVNPCPIPLPPPPPWF